MFVIVWPVLEHDQGVKRAIAISTLVFAASSAVAFATPTEGLSPWQTILPVSMRLSLTLPVAFLFFLTISLYPAILRCEAALLCYTCAIVGDNAGYVAFTRLLGRRQDVTLAVQSVLTALAAVAVAHLPPDDRHDLSSRRRSFGALCRRPSITSTKHISADAEFGLPIVNRFPHDFSYSISAVTTKQQSLGKKNEYFPTRGGDWMVGHFLCGATTAPSTSRDSPQGSESRPVLSEYNDIV
ncbi:hypothetical protein HPB51_026873 [Rhipicephalus microplus]|uniref:Uncharacterized protein n=1 Tax=Rhipicephalus microplus TaxID=6941 RepID=A0A9J6D1V7_RHIMP|nr:hypothetical protein HPB51_026873 [Rhipicephalus microplus]